MKRNKAILSVALASIMTLGSTAGLAANGDVWSKNTGKKYATSEEATLNKDGKGKDITLGQLDYLYEHESKFYSIADLMKEYGKDTTLGKTQFLTKLLEYTAQNSIKKALTDAIAAVEYVVVSTDGSDVLTTEKWTNQDAKDALVASVTVAQGIVDNGNATQTEVDAAVTDLGAAVSTYQSAKQEGTKVAQKKKCETLLYKLAA